MLRAPRCCGWLLLSTLIRTLCTWLNAYAFRGWRCPLGQGARGQNATELEVIVPSLPTSGSTTLQVALEALGLRSYKGDELLFYLPEALEHGLPPEALVGPFRACGVRAFVADDTFGLVPKLLAVSPRAKVVLTVRPWRRWREAWARARSGPEERLFDLLNLLLCNWLPYGLVWPDADAGHSFVKASLTTMLLQNCLRHTRAHLVPASGARLMLPYARLLQNETFYGEWLDMARRLVPAERFLELDLRRHGWPELAAFVGRPAPAAGAPFPRTMGGTNSYDLLKLQLFPAKFLLFWALMLASALLHCLVLRRLAAVPWGSLAAAVRGRAGFKRE